MPRQKPHLLSLHVILRKHSVDQMMFAFVRGVVLTNPCVSVREAARMFEEAFGIEDFEPEHGAQMYYDLLHEYLRQSKIFDEKQNPRSTHRRKADVLLRTELEHPGAEQGRMDTRGGAHPGRGKTTPDRPSGCKPEPAAQ